MAGHVDVGGGATPGDHLFLFQVLALSGHAHINVTVPFFIAPSILHKEFQVQWIGNICMIEFYSNYTLRVDTLSV